jgi:hypothetical protein
MLTKIALSVALVLATASAAFAAAQDSGSPAELEDRDATTKQPPLALGPPQALVTAPHIMWNWNRTQGISTNNKIDYRLDITVAANGTGVADAGIEVTQPTNYPPYYCQTKDWADWRGTIIFTALTMTFPTGWHNTEDQCNPARNGSYRINPVTFQYGLISQNTTLELRMPFYLWNYNDIRLIKVRF